MCQKLASQGPGNCDTNEHSKVDSASRLTHSSSTSNPAKCTKVESLTSSFKLHLTSSSSIIRFVIGSTEQESRHPRVYHLFLQDMAGFLRTHARLRRSTVRSPSRHQRTFLNASEMTTSTDSGFQDLYTGISGF